MPSSAHQQALSKELERLAHDGYRVIDLKTKAPDAIAVKDGRVYAIEVLPRVTPATTSRKTQVYGMFDDIFFVSFGEKDILVRALPSEHDALLQAKLKISQREGREVTWLEILEKGVAAWLAYGPIGGDDVAPRRKQ